MAGGTSGRGYAPALLGSCSDSHTRRQAILALQGEPGAVCPMGQYAPGGSEYEAEVPGSGKFLLQLPEGDQGLGSQSVSRCSSSQGEEAEDIRAGPQRRASASGRQSIRVPAAV